MSENKTATVATTPASQPSPANGKAKGMYEIGKVYEIDPAKVIQRDNRFSSVIADYDFAVLKNDIIKHGQLQPCIGYETSDAKVQLVNGERRFWACENLKIKPKFVFIDPGLASDPQSLALRVLEIDISADMKAKKLTPMDISKKMTMLAETHKVPGKKIAEIFHLSEGAVSQYRNLSRLSVDLQKAVDSGYVGVYDAQGKVKWTKDEQDAYAKQMLDYWREKQKTKNETVDENGLPIIGKPAADGEQQKDAKTPAKKPKEAQQFGLKQLREMLTEFIEPAEKSVRGLLKKGEVPIKHVAVQNAFRWVIAICATKKHDGNTDLREVMAMNWDDVPKPIVAESPEDEDEDDDDGDGE